MSYPKHIKYYIHKTVYQSSFSRMVQNLLSQLNRNEKVLRLSFFGSNIERDEYIENKNIIETEVSKYFQEKIPAFSFVSQAPCDAALIVEVLAYSPRPIEELQYKQLNKRPYVTLYNEDFRMLVVGGFQVDEKGLTIEEQASKVFQEIKDLLEAENFSINEVIRQWNYIKHITAFESHNQHYQLFNNERSCFYDLTDWNNGYPAATGIGTTEGGILVDLDAISSKSSNAFSNPIDNKLQIAAHAYSNKVLFNANNNKSTPKFERAKAFHHKEEQLIYISGTAAIRGESSLDGVGLAEQLKITMENIHMLIGNARITMLRVYLKNREDYEEAKLILDTYELNIPISYLHADVCRDELLIEIEGIAQLVI